MAPRAKKKKSDGIPKGSAASTIDKEDVKKLKAYLKEKNFRDYALFVFNLNVGLRASDLLILKCNQVFDKRWTPKEVTNIIEQKTGKKRELYFNKQARDILRSYRKLYFETLEYDGYLFPSNKKNQGEGHLTVSSLDRILREAKNHLGWQSKYTLSSHSMRKTFGNSLYKKRVPVEIIQEIFNHSDIKTTKLYLDINRDERIKAYRKIE